MGDHYEELNFKTAILAKAGIADCDVSMLSPLTLAYIGDCVYELIVRTMVVSENDVNVNRLHKKTCGYVNAAKQREILQAISEKLTEAELSVARRGRNAKSHSVAKHATVSDYRHATGFEALCGYWYLTGQNERMIELITGAIGAPEDNGEA